MRTHLRKRMRRAFTLIEILIVVVILGILAAIVIPQFTDASQEAMRSSLLTQLQTIRSQVELHNVQNPTTLFDPMNPPVAGEPWSALVNNNYLQSPPKNPFTPSANDDTDVATAPADGGAWVWSNFNGWGTTIYAVNVDGEYLDVDGDGKAD
ncbi:MAG: type II secretion system protein [Planctomycetes bacterium]|nr:type II secretion system protein [Planctomycetota bacterium]